MFNTHLFYGLVAGLAASVVWGIANLIMDGLFLSVIRRHTEQFRENLLARPGLMLLILFADLAFWGALFGIGYGLVYPAFQQWSPLISGIVWGLIMFVSFSRGMIESIILTKLPVDMNVFFFFEGLGGLVAWGAALGLIFSWLL